jgi:hypothetical protein
VDVDLSRRKAPRTVAEQPKRRWWLPFDDALAMGVVYYLLIVTMIVLSSATQYRFFYGNF